MSGFTSYASGKLEQLVEVSRQLGARPDLVLHGGGNTSVKTQVKDITGRRIEVCFVKGSGHDLETITAAGFAPLRLERLRELLPPLEVPVDALRNELRCALLDASAPDPSVETLVHALLPAAYVLHSHSDALLTLGSLPDGEDRIREAFESHFAIVDYAMPGPALVANCSAEWQRRAGDELWGIIVLGHGLFTAADTAEEAWKWHVSAVATAESLIDQAAQAENSIETPSIDRVAIAKLRAEICEAAGKPMILRSWRDAEHVAFASDETLATAVQGPLTPDHAIWTKPLPMVGRDVSAYGEWYTEYFESNAKRTNRRLTQLDPAPRIVLDPELGMVSVGRNRREATVSGELFTHTMRAVATAVARGGYHPASLEHNFDLEYWEYQQEKLHRADKHGKLAGQIALVTGAASGIGRGCAEALLNAGASVIHPRMARPGSECHRFRTGFGGTRRSSGALRRPRHSCSRSGHLPDRGAPR